MSLSMLTTGGWVWLAWCITITFSYAKSVAKRDVDPSHALILGLSLAWLLWLVTP